MENVLRFRGIITLVGLFLAVFLGFKSWETWQNVRLPDFQRPTISVTGEGKIFVKPDIGEIGFAINSEAAKIEDAQARATEVINKVVSMLKEKGVEEKDIQTTNYSINPQYDYPDGARRFRSWQVAQSLKVKIRDLTKTGELISGAAELGVNQVGSLSFTTDDPTKLQAEARDKAIADAKKKAEELAAKLGIKLGKIVSYGEFGGPGPISYFGAAEKGMGGDFSVPQIPTGENEIRVNVTISYQLK
ncbi:MAG: SIMPL domain-containing protein [bacterium]|nr:SIMPL domain-containing protein [bacterium]